MSRRRYTDEDSDESFDEDSEFEDEELDFERTHRHREPIKAPHGNRDKSTERRGDKPRRWRSSDRRDSNPFIH